VSDNDVPNYLTYAAVMVAGSLVILLVTVVVAVWPSSEFSPVTYESPFPVLNDPKVIEVGGELEISVVRCNTGDVSVTDIISFHFQGLEPDGEGDFIVIEGKITDPKVFAARNFQPGCKDDIFSDPLPEEVTAGFWKEVGSTTVIDNGRSDVVRWESEPFGVVDAD